MTISMDDSGTIRIFQGDTGEIVIDGLNPDKNYYVYFAIRDENRNLVGNELMITSNNSDSVTFKLSASLTDLLTVPDGEQFATYYYGVKITEAGSTDEDTVIPELGGQRPMIVFPKVVEGVQ
jgi:hypothetical protein